MKLNAMQCLASGTLACFSLALACLTAGYGELDSNSARGLSVEEDAIEIGKVDWTRDLAAAKKKSKATGKPIFLQFQEVPG